MTIEFASQSRPIIPDERFENIGGQYAQGKRLMSRPFAPVPRDHARKVEEARKPGPSAWVKGYKARVDALLAEPVTEPKRPRTRAGRRFHLADQYHTQGNVIEAQKQERLAHEQGRDEYISYLAGQAAKRAGGHDI